jgi:arylsulfatase A-like enzyme
VPSLRPVLAPVLAGFVLVLSCGAPPPPPPAPRPPSGFVQHARLADGMPRTSTDLAWGAPIGVGGELRSAVTSGRRLHIFAKWAPDGRPFAEGVLPADVGATTPLYATVFGLRGGNVQLTPTPIRVGRDPQSGKAQLGPFDASVREVHETVLGDLTLTPDVATRDLASAPVAIPAGAVLETAFGIEAQALLPGSPAVEFTIVADDGTARTLMQSTIDPVRVAGDRRWIPVRLPLDALAGREVRFRFSARPVPGTGEPVTLPVWSDPVVLAPATQQLPIGIVLISLDTLRGRSTSSGGGWRDTTPALAREVMGEGVTFDNAITTAPHTLPSHVSMFTGRYLRSHGVRSPLSRIPPEERTLTERLAAAGWATAAFTEDGFVVPEVGLARGFGTYRENKSADLHKPLGFADAIFASGLEWLAANGDRPFFLFLHTYQVHLPYVPPPPYDELFEPAQWYKDQKALDLLRYEQEARYLDDQLAIFLAGLDALGLRERTLLVITSDHGEEFGEHGQMTHGHQLYDEVARVPLVMRLPGALPSGRRVSTAVSLVDIAPTVLDLVGLPPMDGADGTSLVPLLIDGAGPFPREAVFGETISSLLAPAVDVIAYRRGDLSCVFHLSKGRHECFDRRLDPAERSPIRFLSGDAREDWAREQVAAFLAKGQAAAGGTPAKGVADTDRFEKLKALGYVGE